MFDGFLRFIMRQRLMVVLGGVLLLGMGAVAWKRLPIDAFPDVTNVQVMVLTNAPGLTPGEVERLVTFPIEIEMGGLPDVRQVRSLSKSGLSQVVVIFEDHVDTYFARQLVFERLAQAKENLPEGLEPELGPISTGPTWSRSRASRSTPTRPWPAGCGCACGCRRARRTRTSRRS